MFLTGWEKKEILNIYNIVLRRENLKKNLKKIYKKRVDVTTTQQF